MLDRHEAHNRPDAHTRDRAREGATDAARPLTDREVPLPGTLAADASASLMHQWLDGDASEADARRLDGKQVDFWKQVLADTGTMREVKAPTRLSANIMAALPTAAPQLTTATRTVTSSQAVVAQSTGLSVATAAAIGAGLFAAGLLLGRAL